MTFTDTDLAALRAAVSGTVLERGDAAVPAEAAAQNTLIQHDPELIVIVESEGDVQESVRFASLHGLPVRVQATGHGAEAAIADGLLILTKKLNGVSIDTEARIASIDAGERWATVVAAAAEHDLAPITGSSPNVGVVGYSLGGGLGPLVRSHGFSSDWVRGFRVVTGDGSLIEANAESHPELFWALRGGKGGLGIVTRILVELVPLRTLYAGTLVFDTADVERALHGWLDWAASAPAEVSTSVAMVNLPDLEVIPEPLRGRFLLNLRFAYPGDAETGAELAAPLRAIAPVYLDMLGELPAAQTGTIHNDPDQPGPVWTSGVELSTIDHEVADRLLAHFGPLAGSPFVAVELRHLGGAARSDVAEGSAVSGRTGEFTLSTIGVVPPRFGEMPGAVEAFLSEIGDRISAETTANFAGKLDSAEKLGRVWPAETLARLDAIRTAYDPEGVFAFGPSSYR